MKKGVFNDPIVPKERRSSGNFAAPTKEEATTGNFMAAGDFYGSGYRNPTGTLRATSMSPIPRKSGRYEAPRSLA